MARAPLTLTNHLDFLGIDPLFADATRRLAAVLVEKGVRLIYGGGGIGLMGVLADAVLAAGGEVTGVIPHFLVRHEVGKAGLTERFPWVVAFTFGLLHGFGFASALNEVGLPPSAIPVALLFFNVGVEVGQLLFIASVFAIIALARQVLRRSGVPQPAWAWRVPPYAIGSVAMFWVIQRIAAF